MFGATPTRPICRNRRLANALTRLESPGTVLDPFIGSGTTVAVAQQLGRHGIGLDLNPGYLAIAAKRLAGITLPLGIGL